MFKIDWKLFLFVLFDILMLIKSEEFKGRDFHGYLNPEEDKKYDYQGYQYPGYYPIREECEKNPMLPLLGKGVNFLLLKLGVIGVVKVVSVLVLLGILAKLPLIFLKFAFLKAFFLPVLFAPLLIGLFSNTMTKPTVQAGSENKPIEGMTDAGEMLGMGTMTMDSGRQLASNISSMAWQSIKMFAESDQCVERISCLIGASNTDSSFQKVFSRMLKFLHYSSPPAVQERMALIKDAFNKGSRGLTCSEEDYKCQSPELLIQHGLTKVKLL